MSIRLSILLLPLVGAMTFLAGSADASTKYVSKVVYKVQSCPPQPVFSAGVRVGGCGLITAPVVVSRQVCAPRTVVERVYVEPVYERVLVGYDRCGRPYYRTVLVRAGGWRYAKYAIQPNGCRDLVCYL
jgi:hypothetical protein